MNNEAQKVFTAGSKHHPESGMVATDLYLARVILREYFTKYALWLDMKTTDDDQQGSGRI